MSKHENEFRQLARLSDAQKWHYLLENKPQWCTVMCDNDDTFITLDDDNEADAVSFDEYIGWSDGIFILLKVAGIKCDSV